jgi:predicted nucleotidyltransferase component of viral defense system
VIPRALITAWRAKAPWSTDAQVEQDLVVCRALVELFSYEPLARELAFRGGTALHKLHFSSSGRYSEDVDLVQLNAGPIGPVMDAVRAALDPWLGKPQWKQGQGRVTFYYRFDSETKPVTPLKLKVETNTREHLCVLGARKARFAVDSRWFSGEVNIPTYEPEELLGTKLRALYQRKKGRDLFDLSEALVRLDGLDTSKVIACFGRYMDHEGRRVTRAEFEDNLAEKIVDDVFVSDVPPLLAPGVSFDVARAHERVREAFISKLPEGSAAKKKRRPR